MLEQHLKEYGETIECIPVGDLLQKEITKKSDFAKRFYEARKSYSYIPDEIVIEIIQPFIEAAE